MLDEVLAVRKATSGDGGFEADVAEGWRQGRGAFGGLVLGLLVHAAEASSDGRPLRSLTAALCGPTRAGPARIAVETLRAGTGVTTLATRLVQGADLQAHAVLVLGRGRDRAHDGVRRPRPDPPDWRSVEPIPDLIMGAAEFSRHFEYRNVGPWPFSSAVEPVTAGWVRPRGPATRDAAWLVACADAWWPGPLATASTPRPMATIAFTFEQVGEVGAVDPEEPLFHRSEMLAGRDGYLVELRELWSADGRLLALNHQTLVAI